MSQAFRLLMISAMYENGGNTTQRLLDGHPELIAYPFESQLGTRLVQDHLSSLYPAKYRWPVFSIEGDAESDYDAIIDEECKVRTKTPQASKFREVVLELADADRKQSFAALMRGRTRTTGSLVECFFRATAQAWRNRVRSDRESVFVGYSPVVGVDAERILRDLPGAHVLNVVRHPFGAYAETKRRPVPLSIAHYATGWCVHLQSALASRARHSERVHLIRYEELIADPTAVLCSVLDKLGVSSSPTLARPSWNGSVLDEVYPWGTIRVPQPAADRQTSSELSDGEREEIARFAGPVARALGYEI